jgi:hypothetical protein
MTLETQKEATPLSNEQIEQLTGLGNVDPSELFGIDINSVEMNRLPPHVQSYCIVARALNGEPLDSWGALGAYPQNKKPEFQDFESITRGLSSEEKSKFFAILKLYLLDLEGCQKELMGNGNMDLRKTVALETMGYAHQWISSLISSANPSAEANDLKSELLNPSPSATPEAPQTNISAFRAHLPNWVKKLLN